MTLRKLNSMKNHSFSERYQSMIFVSDEIEKTSLSTRGDLKQCSTQIWHISMPFKNAVGWWVMLKKIVFYFIFPVVKRNLQ